MGLGMIRFLWLYALAFVLLIAPYALAEKAHKHKHINRVPEEAQLIPNIPPLIATYDIYVGGLHLVTADILFQEEKSHYHTLVKAHTYGFWSHPFPWNSVLDVEGIIKKDHFQPIEFYTVDDWKHHPKETKMHFDDVGNVLTEFDPPNTDQGRDIVTEEQRHGSTDPVTGLLQMLAEVAIKDSCKAVSPIYDGKRRFDLIGSDDRVEDIDEGDYSSYKGSARVCNIEFRMIAGEWKERNHIQNGFWQRSTNEQGREPFSIWLASLAPGLPELPVRLQSGSVWGLIVMHLKSWRYQSAAP